MGLGLALTAAFPQGPPDDPLGVVEAAVRARLAGTRPVLRTDGEGRPVLAIPLHPAAEDLEIALSEAGVLAASANTSTAGPGYHVRVVEVLDAVAETLGVRWESGEDGGDDTGYFEERDVAGLQRQMLGWLQALAETLGAHEGRGLDVCLPAGCGFLLDADTRTPLGPRRRAWWRAVAEQPERGVPFFAWWEPGEGAAYWDGLARALMWSEVRWAAPEDDAERETHRRVLHALARAYRLDPARPLPWREWAELLGYSGVDAPGVAEVRRRAEGERDAPAIGYRRHAVRVPLTGGWSMALPGDLHRSFDDEGTFCAHAGGRTVWFSSLRHRGGRATSLDDLRARRRDGAVELHERDEEGLVGVASLGRHDEDGREGWMLATETASPGRVGILTICFDLEEDRAWALEAWRSLAHAGGGDDEG